MIPKGRGIRCITAFVLLLLLVPGQSTDLKLALRAWEHNQRFRVSQNEAALPKLTAQNKQQASRAMLLFAIRQFCVFADSECIPDVLNNNPDDETLQFFIKRQDCREIATQSGCNSERNCMWIDGKCSADIILAIEDCLDSAYLTIHRGIFDCDFLPTQSKCTEIPGCLWNGATCGIDEENVIAALNRSPAALQKLDQQIKCQDATSCTGVCERTPSGNCVFPAFFDFSPFVTSSRPFCNFIRQIAICESVVSPSKCRGPCDIGTSGACIFPIFSTEFVDITFGSNPALQAQMRTAVAQCPSISLPSACNAFVP